MSRLFMACLLSILSLFELVSTDGEDLNSSYDKLSWFVHISDVHISSWEDETRQTDLKAFVTSTLSIIRPDLVMCGGDLTEAKSSNLQASQDISEWKTYNEIVSSRWNDLPWLDIRGNHDNLNVLNRNSSNNFFSKFSVMGQKGYLGSYIFPMKSRGQNFNIIAIDATWEVGMNYPFNFVGYIDGHQKDILMNISSVMKSDLDSINLMFGHYPTSVIHQSDFLRDFISHGLVYLSGHLHDLAFFKMHNMYTFHDGKNLELELVDWKNNRKFRILAIDNGTLSFTDVLFNEWPVILPTYPKDSRLMMVEKESLMNYKRNTIRVLVFSDSPVTRVIISIDEDEPLEASQAGSGPLFELPWDSKRYSSGLHQLKVKALDAKGRSSTCIQEFTLDVSAVEHMDNFLPNFVLRSSFSTLFRVLFLLTLICNIFIALILKSMYYLAQTGRLPPSKLKYLKICAKLCIFKKYFLVCSYNKLFWPLLCFVLYMAIGPWIVGSLIEGHSGAIFAWGVLVDKQIVHSQVPFAYYFIHFALIHPVVVLFLGHILDYKTSQHISTTKSSNAVHITFLSSYIFVIAIAIFFSITFWLQFGIIGFILGPLKTWSYIFYAVMFWIAWKVPPSHCHTYNTHFNHEAMHKKIDEENLNKDGSEENIQHLL